MIDETLLRKLAKELAIEQKRTEMEQLARLADEKQRYQEKAKSILKDCLKDFMVVHPQVKAFGWVQYTPYFNDGEPCEFSLHEIGFTLKDLTEEELNETRYFDDGDHWIGAYGEYRPKWKPDIHKKQEADGLTEELFKELVALNKQLRTLEEEMRIVFGDHVKVVVTQKGIEVSEFEHD